MGIHSVGCQRGVHYYAMELIEGRTLAQLIEEVRHLAGLGETAGKAVEVSQVTQSLLTGHFGQDVRKPGDDGLTVAMDSIESATVQADETRRRATASDSTKGPHRTGDFFRLVAQLGIQAAEALDHAHQVGVVHRDIKPSNLMVDANRHLWITDFGLAITQTDPGLTMTGDIVGTLRYMSPEQALGDRRRMGHRTDIYSLGITLYELLALQPAFGGDGRETLVRRLVEEDPPAPRSINPAIPRDLETIVLKATSKDPQQRYAVAQDLADDLKRFLADKPICARRATLGMRAVKWAKRHRPTVWSAIILTVIATVTAAGLAWNQHRQSVQLAADVGEHLAAADAFLQSADYAAVDRELAGARGRLETAGYGNGPLADEVTQLAAELRAKQQAIERFDQFQKLRHRIHSEMYAVNRVILDQAQSHCRSALDLYQVKASDSWKQPRDFQDLSPERQASLEEGLVELLFVSARLEIGESGGQTRAELQAAHRRAVDAFSKIQSIHKPIPAVYLWIADSWEALGEKTAAAQARAQAEAIGPSTATDYFVLGQYHTQFGRLEEAVADYWQALDRQPDHYLSLLASGVALTELEKHESAEAMLTGAIAMNPQTVLGFAKRGASRWAQKKILLAQADFQQARRLDPDLAGALIRRAWEHRENFQFDKALGDYSEAMRLDPNAAAFEGRGTLYALQGDLNKALADCNECIRLDPGSAGPYSSRAEVYRLKGEFARAMDDANEALRLDSKHAKTYLCRGRIHLHRGELDKALADLNEAIRLDPTDAGLVAGRAEIYLARGEREKALADCQESIRLDPKNVWGYLELANFHKATGDIDKALRDCDEAVRIAPQYAVVFTRRASFHTSRGDFDKALADYNELVRLTPNDSYAYLFRGRAFNAKGDPNHAMADFNESIRIRPNGGAYCERARIHKTRNDLDLALADNDAAVQLNAKNPTSFSERGETYKLMGEHERAIADFNEAIRLAPTLTYGYAKRAEFYFAVGESEKAEADMKRAEALGPVSWHLYKCWGLAQFRLGHYEAALTHITKAVELNPGDGTNLTWIPPDEVAACPDERLRKGLQELADKAIENTGGTAYVLNNRAVLHGAFGQPEKAMADFAKAIELEPADATSWYLRALARLGAGKADDYRTDCAEMLQRFSQTENPDQAHWVAWTCVLAPQATADWPKVVALAETAVKGDAKSTTNLTALGAVLFRAGRYEDALVRLSEADDLMKHPSEALKSSPVYTWFFLAMAHHHLGQHQEAKKWLDKATVWTDEALRNGIPWNRRLTFKLLRDEADALLNSAPVTQSPEPAIEEKEEYQENANAESGNPS